MSNDRPARLPSLTGLRAVTSLITLLTHVIYLFYPSRVLTFAAVQAVMLVGRIGVTCFFVLSGFLLTWSARSGHSTTSFFRRRFWKIAPNHVLAWTIGMVLILLTGVRPPFSEGGQQITSADIWGLLLVAGWWPTQHDGGPNPNVWSVTCEVFFYALFPVLLPALHRLSDRSLKRTWLIVAATIVILPLPVSFIPGPPITKVIDVNYVTLWACYVLPLTRSLEFVLGMTTARLLQTGQWPRTIPKTVTIGSLFLMCALLPLLPPHYALGPFFVIHTAVLIVAIARADIKGRSGMLAWPTLLLLGDASYALFIYHFPLLMIPAKVIGPVSGPWAFVVTATCMVGMQLVALLIYLYFEKPLMLRYSRRTPSRAPFRAHPNPAGGEQRT